MRTIFGDLNKKFTSTILSDASAALGIIQRQGLGKLRHIDCSYLFVQNLNAEKIIKFSKVIGTENPADLCTKGLSEAEIEKYIKMTHSAFHQGKHELCPQLNTLTDRTCNPASRVSGGAWRCSHMNSVVMSPVVGYKGIWW